jgi:hypothetical protein
MFSLRRIAHNQMDCTILEACLQQQRGIQTFFTWLACPVSAFPIG